jgi:hypothetical protein
MTPCGQSYRWLFFGGTSYLEDVGNKSRLFPGHNLSNRIIVLLKENLLLSFKGVNHHSLSLLSYNPVKENRSIDHMPLQVAPLDMRTHKTTSS